MIAALKVYFRSVGDVWFNLIGYATCNLLVAACTVLLPLVLAVTLGSRVGVLAVVAGILCFLVLGPPLLLGLVEVTAEALKYNERPEVPAMLDFARANAQRAWSLMLLQVLGSVILFFALIFYFQVKAAWALPLVIIVAMVTWTWLGMALYTAPFLLRSERGVLTALRNGLVAMLRYPFFSSTLIVLAILTLILSIVLFPFLVLITLSFFAILRTRATEWVLEKEGLMPARVTSDEG